MSVTPHPLLTALACLGLLAGTPAAAGVPLDPLIPLFHKWQMADAKEAVAKVAAQGHRRVQFCVTLQCALDADQRVRAIGLYRESDAPEGGNRLHPAGPEIQEEVQGYLTEAFGAARAAGLEVAVLLHLNASGEPGGWRNHFDFDPLAPLPESPSYAEAMVTPVLAALAAAVPPDRPLEISLQGEMGRTVFLHPAAWQSLLERARARLPKARFGLSFNHEGVAGEPRVPAPDTAALKRLWQSCDFIGVSMYQAVGLPPRAADFDLSLGLFVGEFRGLGCPLPGDKPIHFVEVGIGGGGLSAEDWKSRIPAAKPAEAARAPYLGSAVASQPNPWDDPALRDLRRAYHRALCEYLADPRPRHPVRRAYLWSFGSWDPHGLEQDRFADPVIIEQIQAHNHRATAKP